LRVISRTSIMTYKRTHESLPAIARELGVDAVVEGSVARSERKARITAQLIYASEDRHLWSGRYERDLSDILQLQAEIAHSIANHVHKLVDPKYSTPPAICTVHPEAYEACLKGNFFRDKLTPQDLDKSIGFFTQAIDLDPAYAQAYGDLSRSYFYLGLFGMDDPGKVFPKARMNAVKALELDDTVASAHNAMAVIHIFHDWDWAAAETECRRAVELNPGASVTHAHFADYMSIRGRHEEAIAEFRRVLELDPLSREHNAWFALILYRARRYDESIAQGGKALDLDPHNANAHWFLALSLEQKGQLPEAIAHLDKAVSLSGGSYHHALLGRAYALAGQTPKALDILDELKGLTQRRYVSPFDIAVTYAGLGDTKAAFDWLEEAYRQRVFRIIEITLPMFDNLRSDPRWHDLVRRIGLQ
jgi:adenylate cyclase